MREALVRTETKKTPSEIIKTLARAGTLALVIIQLLTGAACDTQAPKDIPTVNPTVSGASSTPFPAEVPTPTPQNQTKDNTVNIKPQTNQPAVTKNEPISQKPEDKKPKIEIDQSKDTYTVEANVGTAPVSEVSLPGLLANSIKPLENETTANMSILFPVKLADNQQITVEKEYIAVLTDKTNGVEKKPLGKTFTIPKKGTEIICPVNGEVFQGKFIGLTSLFIRFLGPDDAVYYLLVRTKNANESLPFSEITQNAPSISMDDLNPTCTNYSLKPGLPITAGAPILKTNLDNQRIKFDLQYSYNQKNILTCGDIYSDYSFLTDKNNNILYLPASSDK